eukprot:gene9025-biopygen15215
MAGESESGRGPDAGRTRHGRTAAGRKAFCRHGPVFIDTVVLGPQKAVLEIHEQEIGIRKSKRSRGQELRKVGPETVVGKLDYSPMPTVSFARPE